VVAVAEVLGERYEFLSRIAAGGMGEVWRGRDLRLQRDVAIKVLRAEHDDPDFRSRLHAEARSAGALNCDACVDVYDYGEQTDEAGRFLSYVVMELVEGDTKPAKEAAKKPKPKPKVKLTGRRPGGPGSPVGGPGPGGGGPGPGNHGGDGHGHGGGDDD
jgi:serine/threonine-protein kinase